MSDAAAAARDAGSAPRLLGACALPRAARADQQRDPELKALLQKIIGSADCFADKYDSEVWYKAMEPRLARLVPTHEARIEILDHVYCEAKRDPTLQMPPDLVLALIEVESRFDRWAVSPAGAVGLMQVMPFWPRAARRAESTGEGRAQHPHGLRDPALLPARRESQLVARARPLQRQRRPQHLSRPGDAALAARLALLEHLEASRGIALGRVAASSASLGPPRPAPAPDRAATMRAAPRPRRRALRQHLDRAVG